VYLAYHGNFDPFHPLVFPVWGYFFPGFVVGGLFLASGLSQPYFLTLIQDERTDLPLSFVYVMVGFGALSLGFALPLGRKAGEIIASWLPVWNWRTNQIPIPGLILFVFGLANTIAAFALGLLGFQKVEQIGSYDGLIFLLSLLWSQGSFLLWLFIFRSGKLGWSHYMIIAIMLSVSLSRAGVSRQSWRDRPYTYPDRLRVRSFPQENYIEAKHDRRCGYRDRPGRGNDIRNDVSVRQGFAGRFEHKRDRRYHIAHLEKNLAPPTPRRICQSDLLRLRSAWTLSARSL
jgi:hypothetical protein